MEQKSDGASYDYDFFVIGGGSGGLAAAKEAIKFGVKVAVADFVKPSPQGTTWKLGGTCVNVGCIPKKMMHYSGLLGESYYDQVQAGWVIADKPTHSWEKMIESVNDHVRSLNFGYVKELRSKGIKYYNSFATFETDHTILLTDAKGKQDRVTARYILIAVGGRPSYPGIPGDKEYCITSDDIFWMQNSPGKTLVVGASYVALECAGFLNAMGYETSVMVRSILLRGFDQDIAGKIGADMENVGVQFIHEASPKKVEKLDSGKLLVTYDQGGMTVTGEYDTVMLAIGRKIITDMLKLENAGITCLPNGKFKANADESLDKSHIFACGDVLDGRLELTPVAIEAGRRIARRLFNGSTKLMNYDTIPTTVFTPLEYGCCGLSEEDAVKRHGEANIEVYHSIFSPLEWQYNKGFTSKRQCYVKLVCLIPQNMKIIGFHILCPNAGEVTQGFACAMHVGITKDQLDDVVGIHPTVAEEFTKLTITKREDSNPVKESC